MAIGTIYTTAESGWTRFDDTNSNISFIGQWDYNSNTSNVGGGYYYTSTIGSKAQFNFTGTSLRLICGVNNNLSSNILILIDGKKYTYSIYNSSLVFNKCVFEIVNLTDREHYVEIICNETLRTAFDGIDLIQGEEILPYKKIYVNLALKNPTTNQHYSLADKTLIPLPNTSNKNMILHGLEAGKEIKLDTPFNKIQYVKELSTATQGTSGKIITQKLLEPTNKILKISEVRI